MGASRNPAGGSGSIMAGPLRSGAQRYPYSLRRSGWGCLSGPLAAQSAASISRASQVTSLFIMNAITGRWRGLVAAVAVTPSCMGASMITTAGYGCWIVSAIPAGRDISALIRLRSGSHSRLPTRMDSHLEAILGENTMFQCNRVATSEWRMRRTPDVHSVLVRQLE